MTKKILIIAFIFINAGLQTFSQNIETTQLSSTAFKEYIESGQGVLLDVRTQREFDNGHIENAGQLNYYALDFRKRLLLLPKDQPIYLYCNTGYRSDRAASFLVSNGYTQVYNLQHGIMEWELADLPVIVDPNAQPDMDDKFEPSDFEQLLASEPTVFVNFYAPWCGPCRQMMPMIDSLKVAYHERIPIIKINADASKRLMRDLKMVSVPYLVMYHQGEVVFEHYGIIERETLTKVIETQLLIQ